MANILSAAAKAAQERVADSVKDAKNHVINQFDPRNSIYQLGLGIGPMIRQTVAEYNKQQGKGAKKDAAKSEATLVDIKKINQKSSASLTQLNARLDKMNSLLSEIKSINLRQLSSQRQSVFAERAGDALTAYGMFRGAKTNASDVNNSPKAKEDGEGLMSTLGSMLTSGPGLTVLSIVAGGLIYKNREEIGKFIDNFLKAAGLPTKEELAEQMKKDLKSGVKAVARIVGEGLVEGVSGLMPFLIEELKQRALEAVGLRKEVDKNGKPTGKNMPANPQPLGEVAGASAGTWLGSKLPGWLKIPGMVMGGMTGWGIGEDHPLATLSGGAAALMLALKGKWGAAGKVAQGASGAADDIARAAAGSADDVAKAAAGKVTPNATAAATNMAEKPGFLKSAEELIRERADRIAKEAAETLSPTSGSALAKIVEYVKQMTTMLTEKAAGVLSVSKEAISGVSEAIEKSAIAQGAKAVGKKVIGSGWLGGLISGGLDYMQHKDFTGALINGALNMLFGGAGAALGFISPVPGGAFMGGVGGGLLGEYFADKINNWRRGGVQPVGLNANGYDPNSLRPNFINTNFQNVSTNGGSSQTDQSGEQWIRADMRPYLSPIENGRVTDVVGSDRGDHVHAGTDIAGSKPGMTGVSVRAITDGVIEKVAYDDRSGNYVVLRHSSSSGGADTSLYMHLERVLVQQNQKVSRGEPIGIMGKTGAAKGAHLHLELKKDGQNVNPQSLVAGLGDQPSTATTSLAKSDSQGTSSSGGLASNLSSFGFTEQQIADIGGRNAALKKFQDIGNMLPMLLEAASGGGGGGNNSGGTSSGGNKATPSNKAGGSAKHAIHQGSPVSPRRQV